nr:MAG TPA: anaerobic ribonucleoside triphosphate reductase [Caudoviricetes sp.]
MNVIKRDGRVVLFDKTKIRDAVLKAFQEVDNNITSESSVIADKISDEIENYTENDLTIDDIQNLVEKKLMSSKRKDVAKAYIEYRFFRDKERERNSHLFKEIWAKLNASDVQNQNANMDEKSFGGRIGEAANTMMKSYALKYCMSDMARKNHENNEIYIHDLDHYAIGNHNCLSIPFDDLLANGFNTRQTDVRPAQSVSTAFQLVAVIFQLQSLQQFGGVAATHLDWTMVPYVRKSFRKHYIDGLKYINKINNKELFDHIPNDAGIEDDEYKIHPEAYGYAKDMTKREIKQAVEGMYHNLNTLQSRSGNQLPFTSVNYGTCTLTEGRMITKALLEVSIEGIGKLHKTSIFPCGIFQCMKGVNRKPGEPNYDLFKLALESTSKRLYPNYVNVDWSINAGYDKNDPRTYTSTMGKCKCSSCKILMNLA